MRKIVIVCPRCGYVDRGVETFTFYLKHYLDSKFEIEVVSRKTIWCVPQKYWRWLPKWLDYVHLGDMEMEMLTFSLGSLRSLWTKRMDVLFVQSGVWGAVAARLLRWVKGTPFIYRSAGGKEPWIVRQKPDVYVATTYEIAKWIKKQSPNQQVVVIPNGVDLAKFKPQNSKFKRNAKQMRVLCVGALEQHKRIHLAIAAVANIKHASLTVIGDGPLDKDIEIMGKKMLGKRFNLIRRVPQDQMPRYYQQATVFTLPSWEEPFGIAYVEAMACGLAVVAPDDASRREIVGKNGLYVDVEDADTYAKALVRAARVKVDREGLAQFDWINVAKKYNDLLLKLAVGGVKTT